jgi:hypothetical protein
MDFLRVIFAQVNSISFKNNFYEQNLPLHLKLKLFIFKANYC